MEVDYKFPFLLAYDVFTKRNAKMSRDWSSKSFE